ncbi:MAG: glycosyl transferase [Clostridiales bacterium]|nr:glycosyl transferase [Clostridiales bacterium]
MIPKVIHYCWFGRGEKPKLVLKCIATWHKLLPDYEIKEWNEDNFDINLNDFVRQAYENRNFAFVSDYIRARILYSLGGIYLDTDVEVLKSFDRFLDEKMFVGFEEKQFVGTCVMGAQKGHPLLKSYMAHYENTPYVLEDGRFYSDTNVVLLTAMLEKRGLCRNDEYQCVDEVSVYPRTFFSPYDYINGKSFITENSYAIHHFAKLWLPKRTRLKSDIKRVLVRILGSGLVSKLRGRK